MNTHRNSAPQTSVSNKAESDSLAARAERLRASARALRELADAIDAEVEAIDNARFDWQDREWNRRHPPAQA